jgi:hypothetical protein
MPRGARLDLHVQWGSRGLEAPRRLSCVAIGRSSWLSTRPSSSPARGFRFLLRLSGDCSRGSSGPRLSPDAARGRATTAPAPRSGLYYEHEPTSPEEARADAPDRRTPRAAPVLREPHAGRRPPQGRPRGERRRLHLSDRPSWSERWGPLHSTMRPSGTRARGRQTNSDHRPMCQMPRSGLGMQAALA